MSNLFYVQNEVFNMPQMASLSFYQITILAGRNYWRDQAY